MTVSSVETTNATVPQQATASSAAQNQLTLDYEMFLKLMMEQMKNQDPTEPMNATDQLAQLASFSQVEQAIKTNQKLETLLSNMAFGQVDDLVGRTVTNLDGVTGVVESVQIFSDGTVLNLDSGETMLLGPGLQIA